MQPIPMSEGAKSKLFIEAGEEHLTVRAYEDILKSIVDSEKFTCEDLVGAATFNMKYNQYSCRNLKCKTVITSDHKYTLRNSSPE